MSWLNISTFCTICVAGIIWKLAYQIIYYRYFHPLSGIPGTFWSSTTRLWCAWHNFKCDEVPTYEKLHAKYGPVLRITPTMVLVNDATKLPVIYHRYADKTDSYTTGGFGRTAAILNMLDSTTHAHFRKITATSYSFTNIKRMEPLMDEQIQHWVDKLASRFADTNEQFDFAPWAVYMAYDVISSIGFGAPIGFVEQERDVGGLIKGFHDGSVVLGLLTRLYPFTAWLKSVVPNELLLPNPKQNWGIGSLMKFGKKIITQRLEDIKAGQNSSRTDILQTLLDYEDEDGKHLDVNYIEAEVLLVLAAGADTTGSILQAFIVQLLSYPDVYEKVLNEISEADGSQKLSKVPQYDEVVAHCPYYIACIRETLRLYPSATTLFPRVTPEGGFDIHGYHLPAGTEVTCHPVLINNDASIFGEDAGEFHPERWLDDEKAKFYQKHILTWGYGSRICLGRDIAMMELFKAPLQFLRTFRPRAANPQQPATRVVKGVVTYYENFLINIERRRA